LKRKQNNASTRKRQDLKFEVVDAGEMSETDAEGVASILAGWLMKDMKKESSGPKTVDPIVDEINRSEGGK
jgi:hypothetical protein